MRSSAYRVLCCRSRRSWIHIACARYTHAFLGWLFDEPTFLGRLFDEPGHARVQFIACSSLGQRWQSLLVCSRRYRNLCRKLALHGWCCGRPCHSGVVGHAIALWSEMMALQLAVKLRQCPKGRVNPVAGHHRASRHLEPTAMLPQQGYGRVAEHLPRWQRVRQFDLVPRQQHIPRRLAIGIAAVAPKNGLRSLQRVPERLRLRQLLL